MKSAFNKRRLAMCLLALCLSMFVLASCTPTQQALFRRVVQEREAVRMHPFLVCVRHHESDRGPYPHVNGYQAKNPYSTASGAYQFLNSTWRNVSVKAGHPGYARAMDAPAWVQDGVALWTYHNVGRSPWASSGCR